MSAIGRVCMKNETYLMPRAFSESDHKQEAGYDHRSVKITKKWSVILTQAPQESTIEMGNNQ